MIWAVTSVSCWSWYCYDYWLNSVTICWNIAISRTLDGFMEILSSRVFNVKTVLEKKSQMLALSLSLIWQGFSASWHTFSCTWLSVSRVIVHLLRVVVILLWEQRSMSCVWMCSSLQNLASEGLSVNIVPQLIRWSSVKSILQVAFVIQQLYERQCLEHLLKSQSLSVIASHFFHDIVPEGVMKCFIPPNNVNLMSTTYLFSVLFKIVPRGQVQTPRWSVTRWAGCFIKGSLVGK